MRAPSPTHPLRPLVRHARRGTQQGVATLLVVMALFFLVSMVAAYTSRNLVFEQRTSANQYRATQAFEVAEAGVEWALALINGGRIDATCRATTDAAMGSYRGRYLAVDVDGGTVGPVRWTSPDFGPTALTPSCRRNAAGWTCHCPTNENPVLPDADGPGVSPAFRVQIQGTPTPGMFRLEATACTNADDRCLRTAIGAGVEAAARVRAVVALSPALAAPPAAAITARGDFAVGGTTPLRVVNEDAGTNGVTIRAGRFVTAPLTDLLVSAPGSLAEHSLVEDGGLAALGPERFFYSLFGVSREAYPQLPTVVTFACGGGCGDRLRDAVAANPGRPLWVTDAVVVDSDVQIGAPGQPALIVANGGAELAAGARIAGVLYVQGNWTAVAGGTVDGAVVAEGQVSGTGMPDVRYDPAIVNRIRTTMGTVVRVPGGWRDF